MSKTKQVAGIPLLEVAVALIRTDEQMLVVYNDEWKAFTLPMTKRREWVDPDVPAALERQEEWIEAAARAAAEWLGRTLAPAEITGPPLVDDSQYTQSDRDGTIKRYHFQVFEVKLAGPDRLVPGAVAEWLTLQELRTHRPVSPTTKYLIGRL